MMLSNVVPLWEVMLAAIKLNAVLIPATTLLARDDLADRLERCNVRHAVVEASEAVWQKTSKWKEWYRGPCIPQFLFYVSRI